MIRPLVGVHLCHIAIVMLDSISSKYVRTLEIKKEQSRVWGAHYMPAQARVEVAEVQEAVTISRLEQSSNAVLGVRAVLREVYRSNIVHKVHLITVQRW